MNLDELQSKVEKLLALLKDRHPGLMTWNECLKELISEVCNLTKAEEEVLTAAYAYTKALSKMEHKSVTSDDYHLCKSNLISAAAKLSPLEGN